jgi:hypothetical protein
MNDPSYPTYGRPVVQTGDANGDVARIIDMVAGHPIGMIQHDCSWYPLCRSELRLLLGAMAIMLDQSKGTSPYGHGSYSVVLFLLFSSIIILDFNEERSILPPLIHGIHEGRFPRFPLGIHPS